MRRLLDRYQFSQVAKPCGRQFHAQFLEFNTYSTVNDVKKAKVAAVQEEVRADAVLITLKKEAGEDVEE